MLTAPSIHEVFHERPRRRPRLRRRAGVLHLLVLAVQICVCVGERLRRTYAAAEDGRPPERALALLTPSKQARSKTEA